MSKARARHMEVTRDRKRGRLVTRDVPKERTIRAWAVVCADGSTHSLFQRQGNAATTTVRLNDRFKGDGTLSGVVKGEYVEDCAPHTVVALTGKVKPKGGKRGL